MAARRILLVAFGPFPGVPVNPSAALARQLARTRRPAWADLRLDLEILPTRWSALTRLSQRIAATRPDGVLLLGVAARRRALCIETRAVNAARRADAAHCPPPSARLVPGGPAALGTTVAVPRLVAAARTRFAPVRASRDAGRYLCNASYYRALAEAGAVPVVFVHVPGSRPQAGGRIDPRLAPALGALLRAFAAQVRGPGAHRRARGAPAASINCRATASPC